MSVAPAVATLFHACTHPAVVTLILKLAGEVIDQHAAYLNASDATGLCSWALQLLHLYSAHNLVGWEVGSVLNVWERLGGAFRLQQSQGW